MKITVITVCLNAEKFIFDCIRSVVNQTYENIEHLIIDGGSIDRTLEIIKSFDHEVTLISEKDDGIYEAMNKGIQFSSGDYLLFLNADDYLSNDEVIKEAVLHISKHSADIFYGNILVRNSSVDAFFYKPKSEKYLIDILAVDCLPHQATFFARHIFKSVGLYDLRWRILADYDLCLRAIWKGLIFKYIDLTVSSYSYDGFSSDPFKRLPEFFNIQNQSEIFKNSFFNELRIVRYLLKINELAVRDGVPEITVLNSLSWNIDMNENVLRLQKLLEFVECYGYESGIKKFQQNLKITG
jgi:glycosyltransferase involved in cell wall biosynthesis